MKEEKKAPTLRFKGFTDDWEQCKLGDVCVITMGQSPNSNNYTDNPKDPILVQGNADMKDGQVYPRIWTTEITKTANKGDLILTVRAPVGDVGKTGYDIVIGRGVAAIQGNEFIFQLLKRMKAIGYWIKYSTGSTFESINSSEINNAVIHLPKKHEQIEVGNVLSYLDQTITLHEEKKRQLERLKSALLQKMFADKSEYPAIRFEGFSDEWGPCKLGDITTWTKGQGLSKEYLNNERHGSEAVHYADLYKFSPVMQEVIHWTNSDDGRIIPDNSLLFPASDVTPVGLARTSTLRLSGVKAGGDVIIGQLSERINSSFMSYQINANSKKILPLITGTTVKHVQAKSLATMSVTITNMAEQTAIAGLFERIDNLIALHQRKLDLLKEQKKGFLQKMFV